MAMGFVSLNLLGLAGCGMSSCTASVVISLSAQGYRWADNFILASLQLYKEESSSQPCDEGMMEVRMAH